MGRVNKKQEKERKRGKVKALIYELLCNRNFCGHFKKDGKSYLEHENVPFNNFILICLESVLAEGTIGDVNLVKDLQNMHFFFSSLNNFINRARMGQNKEVVARDLSTVIDSVTKKEKTRGGKNLTKVEQLGQLAKDLDDYLEKI